MTCKLRVKLGLGHTVVIGACTLWLAPIPLRAQSLPGLEVLQQGLAEKTQPGQWNVTLGAGLASVPRYQGADTYRMRLVPLAMIRYDDVFFGPFGLGWAAIHLDGFRAGPILGYEGGRKQSDDPHLYGLGNISSSLTGGVFAAYAFDSLEIGATARQAITQRSNGLSGFARIEYRVRFTPYRWEFRIGPHFDFGNAEHEQTRFGVSPTQSEQSGLPVFTPKGGLQDIGLRTSLTYFSANHLVLRVFADVNRFTGDIADSPIVLDGTQHFLGAGLAYHF